MGKDCVLDELETVILCVIYRNFIWRQGPVMVQAIPPLAAQKWIQPQTKPYTVYSGQCH